MAIIIVKMIGNYINQDVIKYVSYDWFANS